MYQKTRLRLNEKLSLMLRNCSLVAQTEGKKKKDAMLIFEIRSPKILKNLQL